MNKFHPPSTLIIMVVVIFLSACQKENIRNPSGFNDGTKEEQSDFSFSENESERVRISSYQQLYNTFNGESINLNGWKGKKILLLSRNSDLKGSVMFKWIKAMDGAYNYYKKVTGRDPVSHIPNYYIEGRATIADVANTCDAGCGFLGYTGIELQNNTFDVMYNAIKNNNQYDQAVFYEFGRNFWFYGDQLAYKDNDPITTGYAVFMRFMSMEAIRVNGAPFNSWSFVTFRRKVESLIYDYLRNPSLNWSNTLGMGQGVPGSDLGATDLFASFCFRLRKNYGGEFFVRKLWKKAALRPAAATTQEAVDNFFIAACQAANRNLTSVFVTWRWPLSDDAKSIALQYPK